MPLFSVLEEKQIRAAAAAYKAGLAQGLSHVAANNVAFAVWTRVEKESKSSAAAATKKKRKERRRVRIERIEKRKLARIEIQLPKRISSIYSQPTLEPIDALAARVISPAPNPVRIEDFLPLDATVVLPLIPSSEQDLQ